ncbi:MAG: PEP-CTERM sorting domain-containing protein [Akkermansia sp.]|nr:PEP-CTERM sorting domain-containing protein [Akkermansia sp.]
MKKTIIALLALAGISGAAETTGKTYVYTGNSEAWLEYIPNWVEEGTETTLGSSGFLSKTQTAGNTFIVTSGTTAKCGQNANFEEGTLKIENGASAKIQGNSKFTNSTIDIDGSMEFASSGITMSGCELDVASGASLTLSQKVVFNGSELTVHGNDISISAEDVKMKNFTLNVLSGNVAFKKTWFDDGSDSDNGITINLSEGASVSFSESVLNQKWNSTITLSTTFSKGYVKNGTGDVILGEKVLIDFGTRNANSDATLSNYLTSGYFAGESIKVNDSALTLASFDANALTAEDVGKYQFVIDGSQLKVQYAAYSESIPEPTTATLSLLALAGLAARRRRR